MAKSFRASIVHYISALGSKNGHINPDKKHNSGNYLGDLFIWNTAKKYCETMIADIEGQMLREKLVKDKEKLRKEAGNSYPYENVVCESPSFVLVGKVQTPRSSFDKDAFIQKVSVGHKIPKHKLIELAEGCVKKSAAPVSMSIMEKEQ